MSGRCFGCQDGANSCSGNRSRRRNSIMAVTSSVIRGLCLALCANLVLQVECGSGPKKIPKYLKICHRSDPDLNECIKRSIDSLRPMLEKGMPELDIPPCEPLVVPQVVVNQGAGAVSVTSTYSNVNVFGPSKFQLNKVQVDVDNDAMFFEIYLPFLYMESHYKLNGHILALPIKGDGMSYGNYTDVNAYATIKGERLKRDGETYFHVSSFRFRFQIGHATVTLDNLFDGDQVLGASMNMFLNENWRSVVKEIEPILEETIGHLFQDFANKIFDRFTIKQLLPN